MMKFLKETGLVNFVRIVFELGDKMLTLSSLENLIVQCNLSIASGYVASGNDATSPLAIDSQHQPYCQNGCHLAKYIVSNIMMKAHGRKFDKERQKYIDLII